MNDSPLYDDVNGGMAPDASGEAPAPAASPAPAPAAAPNLASAVQDMAPPDVPMPTQQMPQALTDAINQQGDQAAQDLPRFKRTVKSTLGGMLMGLLNGGIPGAVAGGTDPVQMQKVVQGEKDTFDSKVKFASAQAAAMAAEASIKDKQLHQMDEDHQIFVTNNGIEQLKQMQALGLTPTMVVPNNTGGKEAMTGLQQLTATHGAVPPMFTINLGNKIVGFDLNQLTQAPQILDEVNKYRSTTGQSPINAQGWAQLPQQVKNDMTNAALNFTNPLPSEQNLTVYKNYLATAKAAPDSPDKAGKVSQLQGIVDGMQKVLDEQQTRAQKQKVADINSETPALAKRAGAVAYASEAGRQKAALVASGGAQDANGNWNMSSTPVRLVEGFQDPSQLTKRSKDYNATLDAADRYSMQKYGQHFDVAKASSDYKFATNPQTQNTLKYLNSLTGSDNKSGNLGALVNMSDQITRTQFPPINDVAAWARLKSGDPAMASYATAVTEVADQVAKILQGGGSGNGTSDAKLKQAAELFEKGFNKDQIKGVSETLRTLLANRKGELIGDNTYLKRWFSPNGGGAPTQQQQTSGQPQGNRPPGW
jgi:hypothetical protein